MAAFEKPKGDPTAFIKPATTVLSPHLKFGCLSPRLFYEALQRVRTHNSSLMKFPVYSAFLIYEWPDTPVMQVYKACKSCALPNQCSLVLPNSEHRTGAKRFVDKNTNSSQKCSRYSSARHCCYCAHRCSRYHHQGSVALFQVYKEKKEHSKPPVSLLGQLLWREFYYVAAAHTPNYHRMEGNPICKQIPWDNNAEFYRAWEESQTGYPWIDAIMAQLRRTGWMHHLARHCVVRPGSLFDRGPLKLRA